MAHGQFKVLDSDIHIIEPADLWPRYIDAAFRDRAPIGLTGILERHPRLRVAFLEGNCSWVPFLLWRMDEHWEWLGDVDAKELTMAPSGYFKGSASCRSSATRRR